MFNQLKISTNSKQSDKNINNKDKETNNNEEIPINRKALSRKDIIREKKILDDEKNKDKKKTNINKDNNQLIEQKDSIDKSNKEIKKEEKKKDKKEKEPIKKQSLENSGNIQEKMKSLELYFKIRNEGFSKCVTEGPKSFENYHNISSNAFEKNKTVKEIKELKEIKEKEKIENEAMLNLEIEQDAYAFNEDNYKKRRYDKNNIESGKKFFKLRYIKNKLNNLTIGKKQSNSDENNAQIVDESTHQNYDKERTIRKCSSDFILILEKSILSFNIKNYKESYEFLESSGIIKNKGEYGEILLVVSGFDKFLVGEFLAKQKFPNDQKEVLNTFIESINMKQNETKFIDCLRFLFSRLILPKDANLILEIMDKFSINFFDTNKKDLDFVDIFKSSDSVYLLVSTILALNTMFTRKDIKIKNVIKKEEFIKMNKDISKDFIEKLYDELKKNPISMSDDYNESMYRKLAPLVKEDESGKSGIKKSKSGNIYDENKYNNLGNEDKNEENNINNNERSSKDNAIEEQIIEEDENDDDIYDDDPKKGLNKKEFSLKTNLNNLTEEDKKLLKTPHKFYKINGSNKSSQREYILSDDLKKLYYDKKQKKFLIVNHIIDVYNGVNHSHNGNIKKYLKSNPSEEQFSGNFISLILAKDKDQVDLMSDDLESALLWFKAIKSLILEEGNQSIQYKKNIKLEKENKKKAEAIWNKLLIKWNIYGKYLIMKLMERNRFILKEDKQSTNINKVLSNKSISIFLKNIYLKKISKDKELDYNEFFTIYYLGLPNQIRSKIWQILIGNPCGIYTNTYELVGKQIPKIDFKDLDLNNQKNKNFSQDTLSNKIINEIIKKRDLFIIEESKKNLIMTQIYNIARGFFILRPDIPFNKSIISIIFLFLIIFEDEVSTFCNIVNVICSNSLKIFIGDEYEIRNYCSFFNLLLRKYLDKIEKHFSKLEISPALYLVPWFEELFTTTLNIKLLSQIFDLYLINGEIVLFQTSLAIIESLEEELLNLTINEIFKALQRFTENASEADLIRKIKYYSCIKKEYFDWKLQDELAAQKSDLFKIILSSE